MRRVKKVLTLALALVLAAGCLYTGAGAVPSTEISQGSLWEENGSVHLNLSYGTVVTFTSAYLGERFSMTETNPNSGETEQVALLPLVLEPGCISYSTTASGQIYTDPEAYFSDEITYADIGALVCRYFEVLEDGTVVPGGYNDNELVGSAYAIYSNTEPWGDTYLYMTTFKTDQGLVWLTTQPAMDRLTELTGLDLSQPPAADPETGFIDVSSTAYYADAVTWAVENGVTQGTGANTFSPAKTVTRAEAVTFLWRAAGSPAPGSSASPFADVTDPNAYYYKAVLWAVEQGITNGAGNGRFDLTGTLAYDQIFTFLCRFAGEEASGTDWSAAAVQWARESGLTDGLLFTPKSVCPRSDVVYCLWKQLSGDNEQEKPAPEPTPEPTPDPEPAVEVPTETEVYNAIIALKSEYPEGMPWTNDNSYHSEAMHITGYGCAGFAFLCSDTAFSDLPSRTHESFDAIRVGDLIRIGDYHSVVVLEKKADSVVVTEGNFNSSIHWGREIARSSLESEGFYVTTRYPEG